MNSKIRSSKELGASEHRNYISKADAIKNRFFRVIRYILQKNASTWQYGKGKPKVAALLEI